jgi:integrase
MSEGRFQIGEYWLSQRGNSPKWCATWFDHVSRQTKRASLGTADFQDAKIKLAEWVVKHAEMRHEKPQSVLLDTIFVRYYDGHAQNTRSAEVARYALAKWSDFFVGRTVAELTLKRQEAFVKNLQEEGVSPGTIHRIFSAGIAALHYSYKHQEIASVPYVQKPPRGGKRERKLTLAESAALFDAATDDHIFMFLLLAYNTLARPEALLELQPFQVDLDSRLIRLNPPGREQTKKYRPVVPITKTLLPWLRQAQGAFYVNWHGKPVKKINKAFRTTRERAGLDDQVVPYTIRHTMATELRKRKVPAWELQGLMGHRTAGTTETYAEYDPDYQGKAVGAIDAYFQDLGELCERPLVLKGLRASSVLAGDGKEK